MPQEPDFLSGKTVLKPPLRTFQTTHNPLLCCPAVRSACSTFHPKHGWMCSFHVKLFAFNKAQNHCQKEHIEPRCDKSVSVCNIQRDERRSTSSWPSLCSPLRKARPSIQTRSLCTLRLNTLRVLGSLNEDTFYTKTYKRGMRSLKNTSLCRQNNQVMKLKHENDPTH